MFDYSCGVRACPCSESRLAGWRGASCRSERLTPREDRLARGFRCSRFKLYSAQDSYLVVKVHLLTMVTTAPLIASLAHSDHRLCLLGVQEEGLVLFCPCDPM